MCLYTSSNSVHSSKPPTGTWAGVRRAPKPCWSNGSALRLITAYSSFLQSSSRVCSPAELVSDLTAAASMKPSCLSAAFYILTPQPAPVKLREFPWCEWRARTEENRSVCPANPQTSSALQVFHHSSSFRWLESRNVPPCWERSGGGSLVCTVG